MHVEAEKGVASRIRLPITPLILQKLQKVWSTSSMYSAFDRKMVWAACCLGFLVFFVFFFGFLRAAKGMEDSIKILERWESVAYLQYIKIPRQQLAVYSIISVNMIVLCTLHCGHSIIIGTHHANGCMEVGLFMFTCM